MTQPDYGRGQRKPGNVSWENWIEGQITRAQRDGEFDNLPGAGKPIEDLGQGDPMVWVAKKLRAEGIEPEFYLPPQLALAREAELAPARVAALRSEADVREYLQDLNTRVDRMHARPPEGPPVRVKRVDVETLVAQWQQVRDRVAEEARRAAAAAAVPSPAEPVRRSWWRPGRRRAS